MNKTRSRVGFGIGASLHAHERATAPAIEGWSLLVAQEDQTIFHAVPVLHCRPHPPNAGRSPTRRGEESLKANTETLVEALVT